MVAVRHHRLVLLPGHRDVHRGGGGLPEQLPQELEVHLHLVPHRRHARRRHRPLRHVQAEPCCRLHHERVHVHLHLPGGRRDAHDAGRGRAGVRHRGQPYPRGGRFYAEEDAVGKVHGQQLHRARHPVLLHPPHGGGPRAVALRVDGVRVLLRLGHLGDDDVAPRLRLQRRLVAVGQDVPHDRDVHGPLAWAAALYRPVGAVVVQTSAQASGTGLGAQDHASPCHRLFAGRLRAVAGARLAVHVAWASWRARAAARRAGRGVGERMEGPPPAPRRGAAGGGGGGGGREA
mmetsp:Transcript_85091/g.236846  ORF Transcript_85091/g.236846 Transcript_85091/m.236846 type:complete len:289 (-) Transcript_85091:163-1029(-)